MAQNPSRLEDNVKQLNWEKNALLLLKDEVARRGEQGKLGWLQNLEGKIREIDEMTKEAAGLKKGHATEARVRLNKKVIQALRDVIALKERGKANPETVEKILNEVATDKPKRFSSGDLVNFTSDFSKKIGSGAFGEIFEGRFPNGVKIAVKVLFEKIITDGKIITHELLTSEVDATGKISHRNLIKLYGFCFEEEGKKALVYEYMENGSLDKILDGKGPGLHWDKLYDIAIETAKGLSYLHEGCDVKIIHHDVKPSNILLDSKFSPKITDFALAKFINRDVTHRTKTKTRGSIGYGAPEIWIPSSRITTNCDVYSFGVMLFDILKIGFKNPGNKWFPKQVWEKYRVGQLDEIIKACGIPEQSQEKARTLSMVALWCVQYSPEIRPDMKDVVTMLEKNKPDRDPPNPFIPASESSLPPVEQRERDLNLEGNALGTNLILESFEEKCPLGGENLVILYTTTSRSSSFFQDCSEVMSILQSYQVEVVERDYYSNGDTMIELLGLLGKIVIPALFVNGRFIGGATEVKKMDADGTLNILFSGNN